jgi:MYXO-CTERM domain-containing protein
MHLVIRKPPALALFALLFALLCAVPGAAEAACYRLPFSNPNLADGWHSVCCGRTNPHRGVDFPQAEGTAIPAVAAGVVRVNTWSSCLGNVIVLRHSDGMYSGYSHMVRRSTLAVGSTVALRQTVGTVGSTGTCSFGAHLHLTLSDHESGYSTGTTVDPYVYIRQHPSLAETCNGRDDDCDGMVDESLTCTGPDAGASRDAAVADASVMFDGGTADVGWPSDLGVDSNANEPVFIEDSSIIAPDGGSLSLDREPREDVDLQGGCGCRVPAAPIARGWLALGLAALVARRRRRSSRQ